MQDASLCCSTAVSTALLSLQFLSRIYCCGCAEWREDELFTELPAALRAEVAGVLLLGTLRRIPTFAECEPLPTVKKEAPTTPWGYKCTCAAARRHRFLHWAYA